MQLYPVFLIIDSFKVILIIDNKEVKMKKTIKLLISIFFISLIFVGALIYIKPQIIKANTSFGHDEVIKETDENNLVTKTFKIYVN